MAWLSRSLSRLSSTVRWPAARSAVRWAAPAPAPAAVDAGLSAATAAAAAPADAPRALRASSAGMAIVATSAATPLVGAGMAKFLSVAPPACFFFMQTSPLKTMKQIVSEGTTGNLNPLPFVSLAANCVVWSLYGVLQNDMTVLAPNATGAAFGLLYTAIYAKYNAGLYSMPLYLGGGAAVIASALAVTAALPATTAATVLGLAGCTSAVLLMASPLAVIKTIIRDQNTSAMPFETSVATLLNAASWSAYGLLVAQDYMIFAPNVLGLAAATVQMGLFLKYPRQAAAAQGEGEGEGTGEGEGEGEGKGESARDK